MVYFLSITSCWCSWHQLKLPALWDAQLLFNLKKVQSLTLLTLLQPSFSSRKESPLSGDTTSCPRLLTSDIFKNINAIKEIVQANRIMLQPLNWSIFCSVKCREFPSPKHFFLIIQSPIRHGFFFFFFSEDTGWILCLACCEDRVIQIFKMKIKHTAKIIY